MAGLTDPAVGSATAALLDMVVARVTTAADDVVILDLVAAGDDELPQWEPGAHLDVPCPRV